MDFLENEIEIAKLRIDLFHENCMSKFKNNALSNIKMTLGTSIPLKSGQYFFTIEDYYPVNSRRQVSLIIRELKENSSVQSIKYWNFKNNVVRVSVIEKLKDSPFGLISPLGILQYRETSQNGVDKIFVVLNALNIEPLKEILNLIGYAKIIEKSKIDEGVLDFGYILSEKEKLVMEVASSLGYFNIPKRSHLKDIAKRLNLSIVAVDGYIRSAERKIFSKGFTF
ncbi:MAG: helix-turn-helix domain-containing protein [Candidatus Micrarchaeaceae archaeon]